MAASESHPQPHWQDDDDSPHLGIDPHYRLPWFEQLHGHRTDASEDDGRANEDDWPTG